MKTQIILVNIQRKTVHKGIADIAFLMLIVHSSKPKIPATHQNQAD